MIEAHFDKIFALRDRSSMLAAARQFFYDRNVIEVDCPLITRKASVDAHIDLVETSHPSGKRYLHSSPEYGMKRLLAEGIGDIFQLAHVFRQEEVGAKHNPEFMMAEWYRLGLSFEMMIDETIDFIRLFLGDLPKRTLSYREAFIEYVQLDPFSSSREELLQFIREREIETYRGIENESKDNLLNFILGTLVEPRLGESELTALAYYPASQAALAKTRELPEGLCAERFEVYYQGVELCNGYHELADAKEQLKRLEEANSERITLGKETLPIDLSLIEALEKGLPPCCGVAVGFDRLMMLRHKRKHISDILSFCWHRA